MERSTRQTEDCSTVGVLIVGRLRSGIGEIMITDDIGDYEDTVALTPMVIMMDFCGDALRKITIDV